MASVQDWKILGFWKISVKGSTGIEERAEPLTFVVLIFSTCNFTSEFLRQDLPGEEGDFVGISPSVGVDSERELK